MILETAIVQTGLALAAKLIDRIASVTTKSVNPKLDSLISVSQPCRVEPITLVDQRATQHPDLGAILQSLSSVFTGYYLQAVALSVKVGRVNTMRLLDTLSPTRSVGSAMSDLQSSVMSAESYTFGLPSMEAKEPVSEEQKAYDAKEQAFKSQQQNARHEQEAKEAGYKGREQDFKDSQQSDRQQQEGKDTAFKGSTQDDSHALARGELDQKLNGSNVAFGGGTNKLLQESVNLSVGKLVDVTIEDGPSKATFPIMIRLMASIVDSRVMVHILADGNRNGTSFTERWHGWKSGQLQFWRDLVLCTDLVDEHRATLMKDGTDAYGSILGRKNKNMLAAGLSGSPSVGTASSLCVITSSTAKELEREVGGRLKDFRTRQKIFQNTYMMIMVVLDTEWDHVTFYHRGIATSTTLSIGELKAANKGSGPDISDILKAYTLGLSPTL